MTTLAPASGRCKVCVIGVVPSNSLWCEQCGNGPLTTAPPEIRRPLLIPCHHCTRPFHAPVGVGRDKKYCTPGCRQAASWVRHRLRHPVKVLTAAERSEKARKAIRARWAKRDAA